MKCVWKVVSFLFFEYIWIICAYVCSPLPTLLMSLKSGWCLDRYFRDFLVLPDVRSKWLPGGAVWWSIAVPTQPRVLGSSICQAKINAQVLHTQYEEQCMHIRMASAETHPGFTGREVRAKWRSLRGARSDLSHPLFVRRSEAIMIQVTCGISALRFSVQPLEFMFCFMICHFSVSPPKRKIKLN